MEVSLLDPIEQIRIGIGARWPLIWFETREETRSIDDIASSVCDNGQISVFVWSIASGIRRRRSNAELAKVEAQHTAKKAGPFDRIRNRYVEPIEGTEDPNTALSWIDAYAIGSGEKGAVFILAEMDEFVAADPVLRRRLYELSARVVRQAKSLIVMTPRSEIPESLESVVSRVELRPPTAAILREITESYANRFRSRKAESWFLDDQGMDMIAAAGAGLIKPLFERAILSAYAAYGVVDERAVQIVAVEKRRLIDGTGFLQYEDPGSTLDDLGGSDLMKEWLVQRMRAFSPEARAFGLPEPKGMLFAGPPGCGKSLGARAAAAAWGRPLIRLDVGALFGGLVGESEANTRRAITLIEAVAPCVVWIDEIEKGFGGGQGNDGGTSQRVMQSILTWLSEKKSACFIYATANRPDILPAELLRKGRFDEIFAASLPVQSEREDIFRIHLRNRKRDPESFDLVRLGEASPSFSGAEIEQAIVDAMFAAFAAGKDLDTDQILRSIKSTIPIALTMREQIEALSEWAKTRARPASSLSSSSSVVQIDQPKIVEDLIELD